MEDDVVMRDIDAEPSTFPSSTQNINNGNHGMDIDPPQAGSMPPEPMPQEDLPVEPPSSSGLARTAEIAKSSNSIQNDLSNSTDGNQKPVSSLISSTGLAKTAEIAKSSDSILKASTGAAPSSPLSKSQSSLRGSNANSAEAPIDFEPSLLPRSLLWKEDEKGMLGVGGLGNVLTVKASFSRYFPSETVVPNVFAPAPAPFADTELMPTIKEFKFEDVESLFQHDEAAEDKLLGIDDDEADGPRKNRKSTYGERTEDEELLLMEDRELTLDDIDTTLVISGIDKKRGTKSAQSAILTYLREVQKISPQALSRFNRREEFFRIVLGSRSEAAKLDNLKTPLKIGESEYELEFKRPIMYRIVSNDPTISVSQAKKDEVMARAKALNMHLEVLGKRKEIERADEQPRKRSRVEITLTKSNPSPSPNAGSASPIAISPRLPVTIDLNIVKTEAPRDSKKEARDSGRQPLPTDIPVIPLSATGEYFEEDDERLRAIKVILRAKKMPQDGSLWLLCGPLSARVSDAGCVDVTWVEAVLVMQRYPRLVMRFMDAVIDFSGGDVIREVVDS